MRKNSKQGMTLVEILVATLIFSVALAGVLGSMAAIADLIDLAKDASTATSDLKNMVEYIQSAPFAQMATRFPNGTVDGPGGNPYADIVGGYMLLSEHIIVTYADPNADPLETKMTLSWNDKKGRGRNISFSTFKTR